MIGFTRDAILLMPKEEHYWSKDDGWIRTFNSSVNKMVKFVDEHFGAIPQMFTTDSLAVYLSPEKVQWLNVSAPEDLYFARRNCEGLNKMPEGKDLPDEVYKKSREKYPVERGMDKQKRFNIVVDREKMNLKTVIQNCKLVISFENQNVSQYKIYKELKKDRIVLIVNSNNFTVKAYYNGEEIGFSDLTSLSWTLNPVYNWEG